MAIDVNESFLFVFDSVINIAIFQVVRNLSIELLNPAS